MHDLLVVIRGDVHVTVFVVATQVAVFRVVRIYVVKSYARGNELKGIELLDEIVHFYRFEVRTSTESLEFYHIFILFFLKFDYIDFGSLKTRRIDILVEEPLCSFYVKNYQRSLY